MRIIEQLRFVPRQRDYISSLRFIFTLKYLMFTLNDVLKSLVDNLTS